MPLVEIQRAGRRLPTGTGAKQAPLFAQPDLGVAQVLGEVSAELDAFVERERLAEDASYVANGVLQAQRQVYGITQQKQQEFAENTKGYTQSVFAETEKIYKDIAEAAPSDRARSELQKQFATYARSDFATASKWEKQTGVDNYLRDHNASVNMLSLEISENPHRFREVLSKYELLKQSATTFLSPSEANKADLRDRRILGESLYAGTLANNPDAATKIVKSKEFEGLFSAKEIRLFENRAKKYKKTLGDQGQQQVLANGVNTLSQAALGEISLSAIENNPDISEQDKELSIALLMGDEQAIEGFAKLAGVTKGDLDGINSYSMTAELKQLAATFENTVEERAYVNPRRIFEGDTISPEDEDVSEALTKLNIIKNKAVIARNFNTNNRGKGLAKVEFNNLMKQIDATSKKLVEYAADNNPTFSNDTYYDYVFDEVDDLSDNEVVKGELLGYAAAIAERRGIDLFADTPSSDSAKSTLDPVFEELKRRRRKSLGIKPSAPGTARVIVDGQAQDVSTEGDKEVTPSRSVNPPKIRKVYVPGEGLR